MSTFICLCCKKEIELKEPYWKRAKRVALLIKLKWIIENPGFCRRLDPERKILGLPVPSVRRRKSERLEEVQRVGV